MLQAFFYRGRGASRSERQLRGTPHAPRVFQPTGRCWFTSPQLSCSSGERHRPPRAEPYPVGAEAQVDPHVGPEQQRVDEGFSFLHHPLGPHHVLLEGPVLLQDGELGWGSGQGQHRVLGGWKPTENKPQQTETWRNLMRIVVQTAACAGSRGAREGAVQALKHTAPPANPARSARGDAGTAPHPAMNRSGSFERQRRRVSHTARGTKPVFPPDSSGSVSPNPPVRPRWLQTHEGRAGPRVTARWQVSPSPSPVPLVPVVLVVRAEGEPREELRPVKLHLELVPEGTERVPVLQARGGRSPGVGAEPGGQRQARGVTLTNSPSGQSCLFASGKSPESAGAA